MEALASVMDSLQCVYTCTYMYVCASVHVCMYVRANACVYCVLSVYIHVLA